VALNVDDLTIEDLPSLKLADEDSFLLRVATLIYRLFYNKGDAITPISPGYVNTITQKYSVDRNKIHVVGVGVDVSVFEKARTCKLVNSSFKVIYAGVLGVGYDFQQIFDAAKILKNKGLNVEFVIHGHGESTDLVKRMAIAYKLPNVTLSHKHLPSRKDVAKLLGEADALILPMKDYGRPYFGIPSKLYEYQAVGKPVICCAEGEPAKYIRNSNSGIVIKPGDGRALAEAIIYLYQNPKVIETMGEAGRQYVEENLSLEKIGLKFLSSVYKWHVIEKK